MKQDRRRRNRFSPENALQAVIKGSPGAFPNEEPTPGKNILTGGAELFNRHCSLFKAERGLARGYFVSTLFLHRSLSSADCILVPRTTLQSGRECVASAQILADAPIFDKSMLQPLALCTSTQIKEQDAQLPSCGAANFIEKTNYFSFFFFSSFLAGTMPVT